MDEIKAVKKAELLCEDIGMTPFELIALLGKHNSKVMQLKDDSYQKFADIFYQLDNNIYDQNSKGDLLEKLTYVLFNEGFSNLLDCTKNCRTSTNEIDLLLTFNEAARFAGVLQAYDFLDGTFLCECKNYNKKVDVTYVGKFYSLLSVTHNKLGIMIAWEGVSGRGKWDSSQGLIKKIALKDNIHILVLDKEDLRRIYEKKDNLFSILKGKYESLLQDIDYTQYIEKHSAEDQLID
jgi:hypothetical protein